MSSRRFGRWHTINYCHYEAGWTGVWWTESVEVGRTAGVPPLQAGGLGSRSGAVIGLTPASCDGATAALFVAAVSSSSSKDTMATAVQC